jgi:hypothetical protein
MQKMARVLSAYPALVSQGIAGFCEDLSATEGWLFSRFNAFNERKRHNCRARLAWFFSWKHVPNDLVHSS